MLPVLAHLQYFFITGVLPLLYQSVLPATKIDVVILGKRTLPHQREDDSRRRNLGCGPEVLSCWNM